MTLQQKQEVNSVTDLPFIKHFRWSSQLYTETEWQYWETSRHKSHDALWCETSLLYDMRSMMSGHHECYTIKQLSDYLWCTMIKASQTCIKHIKSAFFCCTLDHIIWERTFLSVSLYNIYYEQVDLWATWFNTFPNWLIIMTVLCSWWSCCQNSVSNST